MNWRNLKVLACPLDGKKLTIGLLDDRYNCENCTFSIDEKRLEEIVRDMERQPSKREMSMNESMLNNFGRKTVSEDYSDEIAKL